MKNEWKRCKIDFVCALGLVLLSALGISLLFGGYICAGNDDVMLRSIASGKYTGTPDAHLIYIMYPLGWILKTLYSLLPALLWYDIFMVGMHYVCLFLLLYRLGTLFRSKVSKFTSMVLGLGLTLMVHLPYIVIHQYTVLAGFMAAVAVFWLATADSCKENGYWKDRIVCIVLMILCLWLRNEVFLMALPIGFLILLRQQAEPLQEGEKRSTRLKNTGIFLGIVLVIMLASFAIEKVAYRDVQWKEFQVYNRARTDIYDFYGVAPYDKYEEAYNRIGISYGDWLALYRYDGGLIAELDEEVLSEAAQWSKQEWEAPRQYYSVWRKAVYAVCDVLFFQEVQPIGLFLTVAYILYFLYCYKRNDKAGMLCACGMLLFQAVFIAYFVLLGRFVERVSYGLYMMQLTCLAGWMFRLPGKAQNVVRKERFWICSVGMLLCVFLAVVGLYRVRYTLDEQKRLETTAAEWRVMNAYCKEHEDSTYCMVTESFATSVEKLFAEGSLESTNLVRLGSWIQYSPLEKQRKEQQGVRDLTKQLIEQEDFYIIQSAETNLEWLNTFWQEKGYEAEAVVVDSISVPGGRSFSVIRMQ